jgi:nitrogen PTS system EIIA component
MTDINAYIREDLIVPDLKARTKEEAIKILTEKIFKVRPDAFGEVSRQTAYDKILERERLQSTGVEEGVAFPHARIEGWKDFVLAVGFHRTGLDFASVDGKTSRFVCLMISAPEDNYGVLQAMSAISRFFNNNPHFKKMLSGPLSAEEFVIAFRASRIKTQKQIVAADLVEPARGCVTLDTPIEEATQVMHQERMSIIPVVCERGKFCGQISALEIFRYGLPDFFQQLHTISFVRNIDPFEKYFHYKKGLKVRDLYVKEAQPLRRDNTLMEIIFEMTVNQRVRLFVVEDDRTLLGVIDRFTIIDKVLFF